MLFAKKINLLLLLFLTTVFSASCHNSLPSSESSVLVVGFSGLSSDEFEDITSETPNIDAFINEGVRFTHFYTTSMLENAALASLLTGLYPAEHGVRHNGASQYKNEVESLPEILGAKGHSSFFNSGGPPVLRKSAVSRGFNDFDDLFKSGTSSFISASDVARKALVSIDSRVDQGKFLGVLYFADFMFLETPNRERKLQVLDEALGVLRQGLIKRKLWDGLTVVVIGLRGSGRFESLYDDMMRVPLVIKPSRKPRDLSPSWKVDKFLTLADLGLTLHSFLGVSPSVKSHLNVQDMTPVMESKDFNMNNERALYLESDLLSWRRWGPRLFAIREGEWVYFPVEKKIFNTYTDRAQVHNLYGRDTATQDRLHQIWLAQKDELTAGQGEQAFTLDILSKLKLAKSVFSSLTKLEDKTHQIEEYLSYAVHDSQILQWDFRFLYEQSRTDKIKKLIQKYPSRGLALWRKTVGMPVATKDGVDCERQSRLLREKTFEKNMNFYLKDCKDIEAQTWIKAFWMYKNKKKRDSAVLFEAARSITDKRLEQMTLAHYLWINHASLDLPINLPPDWTSFEYLESQLQGTEFLEFVMRKQGP